MSICSPLAMAKTDSQWAQFKLAARGRRYFLQSRASGSGVSGSTLSVYFKRRWLYPRAHSVISIED